MFRPPHPPPPNRFGLICKLGIFERQDFTEGLRWAGSPPQAETDALFDTGRGGLRASGSSPSGRLRLRSVLGPQDAETTYFCNTCGQPLCARCRDETHRARMFARHDIVALGQRSRDVLQKCSECGEPGGGRVGAGWACPEPSPPPPAARRSAARRALHHVLHRQEVAAVHSLLPGHAGVGRGSGGGGGAGGRPEAGLTRARRPRRESRAHCVDLESAYVQGCERLEQAVLVSAGAPSAPGRACALPPG